MMYRKYLLSVLSVGLMSSSAQLGANDLQTFGRLATGVLGLVVVGSFVSDIQDDLNGVRKSTTLSDDLYTCGKVMLSSTCMAAALSGFSRETMGKALGSSFLVATSWATINRAVVANHDIKFWQSAALVSLYALCKVPAKAIGFPMFDFAE